MGPLLLHFGTLAFEPVHTCPFSGLQDKMYRKKYGRNSEAIFQIMLGASLWTIVFTTLQLLSTGELLVVPEFVHEQKTGVLC